MFENKTAEELKNQMSYLLTNVKNLDLFISNKLYNLSLKYPDAIIDIMEIDDIKFKASNLIPPNKSKKFILELPFETRIKYLKNIESWIELNSSIKQLKINFNNN
ncbi:MAG TPA: hypothetical protein PLN85_00610 [archaeon]|jgi:hypothetical protein|nr:hypothetical protein [archaeon]